MNFYQHSPAQINQLADALEDPDLDMNGLVWKADFHLRELQRRIFELEARIYAIGSGGVRQSIQPLVQADTAPAAWAIFSDDGTAIRLWSKDKATAQEAADKHGRPLVPLYTAPQPTENLHCKSTQKRLATLWGYVKQESARQPLTDEQIIAIADNARAAESGDAGYILPIAFARAIEAAHGIGGEA